MPAAGHDHDSRAAARRRSIRSAEIEWSPVWSLRDGRFKYLPTSLLVFFLPGPGPDQRGFQRLRRRQHARGSHRPGFPRTDRARFVCDLVVQPIAARGSRSRANSTIPISTICGPSSPKPDAGFGCSTSPATSASRPMWRSRHWLKDGKENIEFGSGAHFDPQIAMLRTLTELNQFLSIGLMGGGSGDKSSLDGVTPLRLEDHPYLMPGKNSANAPAATSKFGGLSSREQVEACVRLTARSRPRFYGARSDPCRYRRSGHQSDRARLAAFLSPLRARPALRRSGQAWIARPSDCGKRSQSGSPA